MTAKMREKIRTGLYREADTGDLFLVSSGIKRGGSRTNPSQTPADLACLVRWGTRKQDLPHETSLHRRGATALFVVWYPSISIGERHSRRSNAPWWGQTRGGQKSMWAGCVVQSRGKRWYMYCVLLWTFKYIIMINHTACISLKNVATTDKSTAQC
jgi:hypothetical protein